MTHSHIFLYSFKCYVLFYASFYWKWPATCHIFVKWPVGHKLLDHAVLNHGSATCASRDACGSLAPVKWLSGFDKTWNLNLLLIRINFIKFSLFSYEVT